MYLSKTSLGVWRRLSVYNHLPQEWEDLSSNVENPHGSQTQPPGRRRRKPISPAFPARSFVPSVSVLQQARGSSAGFSDENILTNVYMVISLPAFLLSPDPCPFLVYLLQMNLLPSVEAKGQASSLTFTLVYPWVSWSGCACEHGGGPLLQSLCEKRGGGGMHTIIFLGSVTVWKVGGIHTIIFLGLLFLFLFWKGKIVKRYLKRFWGTKSSFEIWCGALCIMNRSLHCSWLRGLKITVRFSESSVKGRTEPADFGFTLIPQYFLLSLPKVFFMRVCYTKLPCLSILLPLASL